MGESWRYRAGVPKESPRTRRQLAGTFRQCLPAKVTNLGNGHSVVVKINDRGPYTRGRILDLSPRAADALDMKRAGVAAVVIEPVVNQMASPTLVVFQASETAVSQ